MMSRINQRIKNIFKREDGQAIVEFSLIAPIFFIFILGMLQIGVIMNYQNGVLSAAREGARWGAITGNIDGDASRADDIEDEVVDKVEKYIKMLTWNENLVEVDTGAVMFPDGPTNPKGGDKLQVTVRYPLEPFFPIPTSLLGGDGSNILPNTIIIEHSVVAVLEDV
ncbi:MAG: TadE/TadG family type IV pilus assembly protein [Bacillota bacterium]